MLNVDATDVWNLKVGLVLCSEKQTIHNIEKRLVGFLQQLQAGKSRL